MEREFADVRQHLPLRAVEFQILVGLSRGPRHGYALLQEAEERGDGAAVPGLATLYRALRRLEADGWISEVEDAGPPEEDAAPGTAERRRTFRLTELGVRIVGAETRRLGSLVRTVEAALASTDGGPAGTPARGDA